MVYKLISHWFQHYCISWLFCVILKRPCPLFPLKILYMFCLILCPITMISNSPKDLSLYLDKNTIKILLGATLRNDVHSSAADAGKIIINSFSSNNFPSPISLTVSLCALLHGTLGLETRLLWSCSRSCRRGLWCVLKENQFGVVAFPSTAHCKTIPKLLWQYKMVHASLWIILSVLLTEIFVLIDGISLCKHVF